MYSIQLAERERTLMDPKRKSRVTLVEFLAQMVAAVEYIRKTSSLSLSLVVISFFFFFCLTRKDEETSRMTYAAQPAALGCFPNRFSHVTLAPMYSTRGTMQHNKRREVALLIITKRASKQSCRRPFRRYIRLHQYIILRREGQDDTRNNVSFWWHGSYLRPADRITCTVYIYICVCGCVCKQA